MQELISPELLGAALRIFGSVEGPVPVYLQESPADVRIGGGSAGPQTIQTLAIDATIKPWMVAVVERLDELLDLDFVFSPTSNGSKINVYLDTVINLGGGGTTLGVALSNEFRRSSWWEVILNGPPLLADQGYFQFAFVHELGHVLGLEHPFDGSDGDLAGERFGDPDASVTVMSYTRPADGWPDFYRAADLAALVSIWGLEEDTPTWLIRDASGAELLLELAQAETRLGQLREGDALLGPAPEAPQMPELQRRDGDPGRLSVTGLVNQASWDVSWDGGLSWIAGDGVELVLPDAAPRELQLRQRDRWGRLSPTFVGLISPTQLLEVGPELLLPPTGTRPGLEPLLTGPSGDAVLLWGMEPRLASDAERATTIRAAVAELDALVSLDLMELDVADVDTPPALLQLLFRVSADGAGPEAPGLIAIDRERDLMGQNETRLSDRLQVALLPTAMSAEAALRQAVLQGLGHAGGLQTGPEGLRPETSVMAPINSTAAVADAPSFTALDQAALIALLGEEQHGASQADLARLNTSPALLRFGEPAVSYRRDASGREWTQLTLPIQRSGNGELRVPLAWLAGGQQGELLLEPGQTEALLELELRSGEQQQLRLEVELPMQAAMDAGSAASLDLDLHALEFGLSTAELIDQNATTGSKPWTRGLVTWTLEPELEGTWGDRLRTMLSALDEACGLDVVEVAASHPLLQWRFAAAATAERGLQSGQSEQLRFALGPDPAAKAMQGPGSQEQALLQSLLLELGLERPEQEGDGDAYRRTPVFPEDSALFNATRAGSSSQAALQPMDVEALQQLHGAGSAKQTTPGVGPALSLELIEAKTGLRLTDQGLERQLSLAVTRSGDLSGSNWLVLREDSQGLAEAIELQPSQQVAEITMPWPTRTAAGLDLKLEVLNGDHDPEASSLGLARSQSDLMSLGRQLLPDPITGWTPDLDGDGVLETDLEGLLMLRSAFGTFPGESLTAGLNWPADATVSDASSLTTPLVSGQVQEWLETGLSSGLGAIRPDAIMHFLQFSPIPTYPSG